MLTAGIVDVVGSTTSIMMEARESKVVSYLGMYMRAGVGDEEWTSCTTAMRGGGEDTQLGYNTGLGCSDRQMVGPTRVHISGTTLL